MRKKTNKTKKEKTVNYRKKIIDLLEKKYSYFAIGATVLTLTVYFAVKSNLFFPIKGQKKQLIKKTEKTVKINQKNVYQVKEGDTLWSIAEKFYGSGFNVDDIVKANNIKNPDKVEKGQLLIIPLVKPRSPTQGEINTHQTKKVEENKDFYIVQPGDDLWQIALKTYGDGYAWPRIAEANKLVNPNLIEAGTRLFIPR